MPSIAPTRVSLGRSIFYGLVTEQQTRGGERLVERSGRQRHAPPFAIDQQPEVFQQRRIPDLPDSISTQELSVHIARGCGHGLRELLGRVQRVGQRQARFLLERAGDDPTPDPVATPAAGRCTTARYISFSINVSSADGSILACRLVREGLSPGRAAPRPIRTVEHSGAAPNDMGPERDARTGDIAPQHVQPLVPVVELLVIAAFEADARQSKRLQLIAERVRQRSRRDVRRVGNRAPPRSARGAGHCERA